MYILICTLSLLVFFIRLNEKLIEIFLCDVYCVKGLKFEKETMKALANQFDLKLETSSSYYLYVWYFSKHFVNITYETVG